MNNKQASLGFINNIIVWHKTSTYLQVRKRQGVSVSLLLETKHKVFRLKMKPIPQTPVQDVKCSLKICIANTQLSVALATGWS